MLYGGTAVRATGANPSGFPRSTLSTGLICCVLRVARLTAERIKATYTFNRRSFLRLIAQRQAGRQDPLLYPFPVAQQGESIDVSALFAYKLNWQSVLFFGYQEASAWSPLTTDLEPAGRSLFLKVSYAFQR